MMNKPKSSLSFALNTPSQCTILINDEKNLKSVHPLDLNTHLSNSICCHLLILTVRLHNLQTICIF